MTTAQGRVTSTLWHDLTAGLVVFLVAIPLCLGIALASDAPLLSGVLSGIIGGLVVGLISQSQVSVSGPAAGLAAIVAAEIAALGSFPAFLLAVLVSGVIQILLGFARAGGLAAFLPSSVIKGLLAAIGVLLILKQFPHLLGHDTNPVGEMSFQQPDHENTFTELAHMVDDVNPGPMVIGLLSVAVLLVWGQFKPLKNSVIPGPLAVVLCGVGLAWLFQRLGGAWSIAPGHFVQVPVAASLSDFAGYLQPPDFSHWSNPSVYQAAVTLAAVASIETLLNLEAVDRLDPLQRSSPPNRELLAQGVGNVAAGLIGGIPITSVIVRGSVNVNAGARTKLSTIVHGLLLLVSVIFLPHWLNRIPLACLAGILIVTGVKLASPQLAREMWDAGRYQFVPFIVTVVSIVLTDLLIGVGIGLAISLGFILHSNLRRPIRRVVEKYLGGDVLHIELANQVSFLNRAALSMVLDEVPHGGNVLIDAQDSDYIDPDVLGLIRDYKNRTAPVRKVRVSLVGFKERYHIEDEVRYVDYSTRELQSAMEPLQVLHLFREGNERFRTGRRLTRDLGRQVHATADGQHPLAVVLSCIDSRTPAELVFDLGVGDVFSVRIAGNIISPEVLGSIEYACAVAGAKLILVMGHTRCGAVMAAVRFASTAESASQATGCQHLDPIVEVIQESIEASTLRRLGDLPPEEFEQVVDKVARTNVARISGKILGMSPALDRLHRQGKIAIVGAVYDVGTRTIDFLTPTLERSDR